MIIPNRQPPQLYHCKSSQKVEKIEFIGVDVSKDSLVVARPATENQRGDWQFLVIKNQLTEIESWVEQLDAAQVQVILEATGTYSGRLVSVLAAAGVAFSVVAPRQASQFSAGVLKNITKNDQRDACALAQFGERMRPPLHQLPPQSVQHLRQLRSVLNQMKTQRQALSNHRQALEHLPDTHPLAFESLDGMLQHFDEKTQVLENQINGLTDACFETQIELAMSVPGIGRKTATALMSATGGFQNFEKVKQLAKFAGIAPRQFQSGKTSQRGRIHRAADGELRSLLYIASWSAVQYNRECGEVRKRLKNRGLAPKAVLIAVAHKLLRQVWGVIKSGKPFDNDFEEKRKLEKMEKREATVLAAAA